MCGQRSQVNGSVHGYKDPPVPTRLVDSSPYQRILPPGHPVPPRPLPGVGLGSKPPKIRTGTQTDIRVCGLPVRPVTRIGKTDPKSLGINSSESGIPLVPSDLQGQDIYVSYRPSHSHGKAGASGQASHETHSVAPKEKLEGSRVVGKANSSSKVSSPTPPVVDQGGECSLRSTPAPTSACRPGLYRCLKRRLGYSLRRLYSKRLLVNTRKPLTHKFPRIKGCTSGPKKVPVLGKGPGRLNSHRQHYSCGIHQQGGGYEVRPTLCPSLAPPVLVQSETYCPQGQTHTRSSECDCGQAITRRSDNSDGMVFTSTSVRPLVPNLASPSGCHVCDQVQLQTAQVRVPSSGSELLGSGCSNSVLGGSRHVCLSPSGPSGQSDQQAIRSPRLAQHAMVLGSGGPVVSDTHLSPKSSRTSDSTVQRSSPQGSGQSQPPRLAPRAEAMKEQGFSSPVAVCIEAPQRRSTRTVYEAKWSVFVRWCEASQVDFRSPSTKQIADFFLHLFQDKNLQPSTIDGYRSAIADKLGNASLNISKDESLNRLYDSFHRDRPKGRRGVPSWNLSLVLHQLTKPPFELLRKASLKHLTFKTVFLLALGSGKRRSEIHAWMNKNIRHQADWAKVFLYCPSFLSKNHLAKEGPECVALVVIPALAPTLDKSLKEDRSLCPVRALRYYLDKTQDLPQGKDLVFVSFKKGFNRDISPTISSWIKQTVILCYEVSDQEALTLHQVKAHDVRAFAASKAFQGGISLDQILATCHWKSHTTFTQFYLKDVAWADSELFHLGPVVAAQQIHQ